MSSVRSHFTLRQWMAQLLPERNECARQAGWQLLLALLYDFTTNLSQLARQLPGKRPAKGARQFLTRWLAHPAWAPEEVYAGLTRQLTRVLRRGQRVVLLVDFTYLQHDWAVLQVSVAWQRRALPLYRAVIRRKQGVEKGGEAALLTIALTWLGQHLPGARRRYVLLMDRGLPSHRLLRRFQQEGWRFVCRLRREWKINHPAFTGYLAELEGQRAWCGPRPRILRDGWLGRKGKGKDTWSTAHVVCFHGVGHREAWFLATSEHRAGRAVALYRQRMQIECEFRDLKDVDDGGLDKLAGWSHQDCLARFLAWVALWEWWLALVWVRHQLEAWRAQATVWGRLSWLTLTRAWLAQQYQDQVYLVLNRL